VTYVLAHGLDVVFIKLSGSVLMKWYHVMTCKFILRSAHDARFSLEKRL
jgi:hypothetical protein